MNAKPLFSIEGKVALVTGGSRGIGAMIARGFVESGARVYVTSRKARTGAVAAELSKLAPATRWPRTSRATRWPALPARSRRASPSSTSW